MYSVKNNLHKPRVYAGLRGKYSIYKTLQNYIVMGSNPFLAITQTPVSTRLSGVCFIFLKWWHYYSACDIMKRKYIFSFISAIEAILGILSS